MAYDTEFARFHVLNLSNLLKDFGSLRWFHGWSIYIHIYFAIKKEALK
jgi:hypothetical protein